jgi:hypothetical protein
MFVVFVFDGTLSWERSFKVSAGAVLKRPRRPGVNMPSLVYFKNFMQDALIISTIVVLHSRNTHASLTLAESLDTSLHLPPAASEPLIYRHRPPQPPHGEADEKEPAGVFSMLQSIRPRLIRIETSLFYAAPCNATSPLAVACINSKRAQGLKARMGQDGTLS